MATTFAVPDGRVAMAATLYTGNGIGVGQSITNTVNTVSFQPDLVWIKSRSGAYDHGLNDSNRGAGKFLYPNLTIAEGNYPTDFASFNSNGFTLGTAAGTITNNSGSTYVGWQWNAGGTTVTNGVGTISSQVRANTTAGFSVVTYTGNGSASATVGHGLGVIPGMVITKGRSGVTEWMVKHQSLPTGQNLILNQTLDAPTSLTFSGGVIANLTNNATFGFTTGSVGVANANGSGVTYVAYCWAPIAGYSAFGSYTGNGAGPNGPFVYLGFRPRWLMIKCSSNSTTYTSWYMVDTAREPGNISSGIVPDLWANLAVVEGYRGNGVANPDTANYVDILSNGFKVISTNSDEVNTSGYTYIYAAFAENPLKYANAR